MRKVGLEGGKNMFDRINGLLNALFSDIQTTFITLFAIGILICAVGAWAGDEQTTPRFKKGLTLCVVGLVAFLLADPMVTYFQNRL